MPKIIEYRNQSSGTAPFLPSQPVGPAGAPGIAIIGAGQAISQAGSAFMARNERRDRSKLQVELAKARTDLTIARDTHVKEGTTLQDNFLEAFGNQVSERVRTIPDQMKSRTGRELATAAGGILTEEFRLSAFEAKAAGEGTFAKVNYLDALNANRNTLLQDPLQFDSILQETMVALGDSAGPFAMIPAKDFQQLVVQTRRELGISALKGHLRVSGPDFTENSLKAGKWDAHINAEDKAAMFGAVDVERRGRIVEDERLRKQKERVLKDTREQIKDGFVSKMVENKLTARDILDSDLMAAEKEHFIAAIKAKNEGRMNDNSGLVSALFDRIHLPNGHPDKIVSENTLYPHVGRGLGETGLQFLRKELKDVRDPANVSLNETRKNFFKSAKSQITKSNLFLADPQGDTQFFMYQQFVQLQMLETQEKGENVFELFDPRSKKYVGSPEILRMFQRTPQQIMEEQAEFIKRSRDKPPDIVWPGATSNKTVERVEGESVQDYLKRIGKTQ